MSIEELLRILLEAEGPICLERLIDEASVHRPRRGSLWVASYRDENGVQRWQSTGERDRAAAQAIADQLEAEARRKRAAQATTTAKPTIRIFRGSALLTQAEVAAIMRLSERTIRKTERDAFEKLRNHPKLRAFWKQYLSGNLEETGFQQDADPDLTDAEIAALFALAETRLERQALTKLLRFLDLQSTNQLGA